MKSELDHILHNRRKEFEAHGLTISAPVLESWKRSMLHGLDPSSTAPWKAPREPDIRLVECASRVVEKRLRDLARSSGVLSLTDPDCVILQQWEGDRRLFDKLLDNDVGPGYLVAEQAIGTSSGITLMSRQPELVRGPEHFAEQFRDVSSAGMVITHPVSGVVVGSLHLTNRFTGSSPLALNWVVELVRHIEREIMRASTKREKLLMASFLEEKRDVRHAVVAVNEQTIISNAAAARLLGQVDQARLWELASRVTSEGSCILEIGGGVQLEVACRAVRDVGAILRFLPPRAVKAPRPENVVLLPGLAGHSARWRILCQQIADAGQAPLLLIGERGVGKTAIARALCENKQTTEIDAERDASISVRPGDQCLVIRHADRLERLANIPRDVRVIMTAAAVPDGYDGDAAIIKVPALHDRMADLPVLVHALSARSRRSVVWTTDALKALSRIEWTANIASLAQLVERVLGTVTTDYVGARDLPADLQVRAAKRRLVGLERIEANAILQAIQDANGNRYQAAKSLGIARSTLYRKMCALGLDLESSTF